MSHRSLRRGLLAALASAGLFAAALPAAAQTVLRYSNWLPVGYMVRAQILEPWMADVEKVTQGRVKVETTPKVVGTVAGQFDVVRDGLADLALIVPGYTPGRFELVEGLEMPFLGDVPEARSPATWRIWDKDLKRFDEFKGVQVLSVFTGNAAQFFTSKKELKTIDDFKGVKLRSPQPATTQAITLLGGVPVLKPVPEIYELASSGVIDGGVITPETIIGFKLDGVLKRMTYLPGGVANTVLLWAINPAKWATIAKADQEAILKVSGEAMAKLAGKAHGDAYRASLDQFTKAGNVVEKLSPAVVEQIKVRIKPVETEWVERAKKKGLANPEQMLTELRDDIAASTPR